MRLVKSTTLSLEILAAHKMRSLLSMLGILAGVGAVILMVSVSQAAEQRVLGRIRDMGTNLLIVAAGQTHLVAGRERQMTTVRTLLPSDARAIVEECPSVRVAVPAVSKKLPIHFETEDTNTNVVGLTPDGFSVRNRKLASGRLFTPEEERGRRRVAVIAPTVVTNLFGDSDPLEHVIRINRIPFEVIGVTQPKGPDQNGVDRDDQVFVPLTTAMRRLINVTYVDHIYIQASSSDRLHDAEHEVRAILRQRHRLREKADDFTIQNQATLLETERQISGSMTLLLGSVAGISLIVGGIGILAVMLITVRERTEEIGLRRAIGGTRRDIRNQFLIESMLLSGGGGLLGVASGIAGTVITCRINGWDLFLSWPSAGIGLAFSVTLGVLFGLYPAVRAARLEPIEALRAE